MLVYPKANSWSGLVSSSEESRILCSKELNIKIQEITFEIKLFVVFLLGNVFILFKFMFGAILFFLEQL